MMRGESSKRDEGGGVPVLKHAPGKHISLFYISMYTSRNNIRGPRAREG